MTPFLDLIREEETPAPKPRNVDALNKQSYDLMDQMMKGVQRKR